MKFNTKNICLTGFGIALFVVLSLCLQVPIFQNYYLCLGYIVMALFCSVNIVSGTIVGTLGVILYCLLINGLRGMPGWTLGNIIIGICLGLAFKLSKKIESKILKYLILVLFVVLGTAIGILGVKSLTEVILYAQPFLVRTASNIYAFVADVFVLIFSIPICELIKKQFKLEIL